MARLEKQFSLHVVESIIKGFACKRMPVIRVNTLKTDIQIVMRYLKEINVLFERISFLPDALIIRNRDEKFFEGLDVYKNGEIYFQGLSSQLPALFLNPSPGENVLDMAAAPGSKTAQMGMMMRNKGEILANEIDTIRLEKLKYNLEKQGIKIATVNLGDGSYLGENFAGKFDKVLLDAPCSAEGRIELSDPRSYRFWSEKNIRQNAKLQKELFESGVKALKPGGTMVYSTCTLAPEENEMIVDTMLKEFKGILKIEKINLDFKYKLPIVETFEGTHFDQRVKDCLKALPSEISEGFFIAKFRKSGSPHGLLNSYANPLYLQKP